MDFPTITEISSKNKSWKKNPGNLEFGGNIDLDGRHLGPDSRIGLKILLSFNLKIIHQLHIDIRLTLHRVEIIVKLKNKRLKNLKHFKSNIFSNLCSFDSADFLWHKLVCLVDLLLQTRQERHVCNLQLSTKIKQFSQFFLSQFFYVVY